MPPVDRPSRTSSAAGWAVIAVLFAATTGVESMSWSQLTAYTPLYLHELHVPADQVPGWIAAMSSLGWILALPLADGEAVPDQALRHDPQAGDAGLAQQLALMGPPDLPCALGIFRQVQAPVYGLDSKPN